MAQPQPSPRGSDPVRPDSVQRHVIKTIILVCVFYAWLPMNIYFILLSLDANLNLWLLHSVYYFISFLYWLYLRQA